MKAVIMAGGFGTRLRPLTMTIPKPMVPIANTPMMEHIVNLLKKHNVNDFVSVLYFHPDVITNHFGNGEKFGISMNYVTAVADYGTAGAVRNAYKLLDERFIVISGDVLTDFDISKALNFHIEKQAKATILLTRVSKPLQYGIVITNDEGKITRFLEKPSWGQVFSDTINTGIYILEQEVLDLIPYQQEFDFSKDLFPLMLKNNIPLYGYIADGYWKDVGNLDEYLLGQHDAVRNNIKVELKGILDGNVTVSETSSIDPTVVFKGNVIIGENSIISQHCTISDSIIGNNVKIGSGAKLFGATLWDDVSIGEFTEISHSVVCNDVKIGNSSLIENNVFIAENCRIGANCRINSNLKIWPNKEIEEGSVVTHSMVQEDVWSKELFSGARISGISNVEIYPEFAAKLGASLGMAYGRNVNILASRDPDGFSRIIKRSIVAGLSSVGVTVNDLQLMSIPQTRQELLTGKYVGGFHIRRSPRDIEKTDIIIFNSDGRDISVSKTKSIERYFYGEDIERVNYKEIGRILFPERTNEIYLNRFMNSLKIPLIQRKNFKILIDFSFGLASSSLPQILGNIGVDVISLNNFIDATRFHPDPVDQTFVDDEVSKIMKSIGYELGFRIEPGAEKISLIDERGVWISHQRLLSILTKLFLETHKEVEPYKIAVSILATNEIEEIAKDYNVEVIRIKNSHSAMMDATIDNKVLFVGSIHGGFIFREFLFASDGMFTIGQILEMLAITHTKISDLDKELPKRIFKYGEVRVPWELKGYIMRRAMQYSENLSRELVEGVKIFFDNESVVLMPSTEKAVFGVFVDALTLESANDLLNKHVDIINKWKQDKQENS
jgi:mannose-1-phosphate guanylyltransferase/phosphomannomutase